MTDTYDAEFDWDKLETGLPDDIDGTMVGCEWRYDAEYNNGDTLFMAFRLIDPVTGEESTEQRLTPGKGWVPIDGGRAIEREDGKPKNFQQMSAIGQAFTKLREMGEVSVSEMVKARGAVPTHVDFWEGVTFHWNTFEESGTFDGERKTWNRFLPTAVVDLGVKGGAGAGVGAKSAPSAPAGKAAAPAAAKGAVKAAAPATPAADVPADAPVAGNNPQGIDDGVYSRIFDIAYAAANPEDYQSACYTDIPEVTEEAVLAAVEDLGPESIWQAAVDKFNADNA